MTALKATEQASVLGTFVPPGVIMPFAAALAPTGWLICDGAPISRTTYANLFSAIRTTWGIGDDSASFVLPDFRGKFIRGRSAASTNDPDKLARTAQTASTFTRASCVTTNLQAYVTLASTTGISVGMSITGSNIPANTFIGSIDSATQFSMVQQDGSTAQNATGSGTVTLTFSQSALGNFVGSVQGDKFQGHKHNVSGNTANESAHTHNSGYWANQVNYTSGSQGAWLTTFAFDQFATSAGTAHLHGVNLDSAVPKNDGSNGEPRPGTESRPLNANVNYIIKY